MIGQDYHGVDDEGTARVGVADSLPQMADVIHEQTVLPVEQVDREEIAATGDEDAAIIRHDTT